MGIDDGATPCHIGTDGSLVTGDMGDKLGYWGGSLGRNRGVAMVILYLHTNKVGFMQFNAIQVDFRMIL